MYAHAKLKYLKIKTETNICTEPGRAVEECRINVHHRKYRRCEQHFQRPKGRQSAKPDTAGHQAALPGQPEVMVQKHPWTTPMIHDAESKQIRVQMVNEQKTPYTVSFEPTFQNVLEKIEYWCYSVSDCE